MDARQELKSLKKALRALTFMNRCGDATVSDVAKAIGVPRPTSYRILETLASEGYVEKQEHSGFYRITSRVQHLASGFRDEEWMVEKARPMVTALSQELGWSITLSIPRGTDMIVRLNTDYDCAMALHRFPVGFAARMLHTTCGYAYLSQCPRDERDQLVAAALERERATPLQGVSDDLRYLTMTDHGSHLTRFDKNRHDEIHYVIDTVRDRGFCNIEFKQFREGNIGVPLLIEGRPVGGMAMRYIKSVMKKADIHGVYVPKLQALARSIADTHVEARRHPPVRSDSGLVAEAVGA